MNAAEWSQVRDLFERALDLPVRERRRFVDAQAPVSAEVRRELERLLVHASDDTNFLAAPAPGTIAATVAPWRPTAGERVGAFRIERLLGEGGMGSVYEARQERPARSVALKLMHVGLGSAPSRRRFETEAEILGHLRHPGIATIHEAGVHRAPSGTEVPFFAMEFVEGARDLVGYACERELGLAARLALFGAVCDAVHHAHQKGVIHRDLKPGNVLVDAAGQVKVIDYGVARVASGALARTQFTQAGFVLGTLQYMSPEQVSGAAGDVDTQSDVYALGVILYELIAGCLPYDVEGRSIAEIVSDVCERQPEPPSRHAPDAPRELDWIVLRALAKERERRYASAAQLREDIDRYLRDEPVLAGPPTKRYRLAKFVARNRALVGVACLLVLSLVAGIVATSLARIEAEEARDAQARLTTAARAAQREAERARDAEAQQRAQAQLAQAAAEEARDAQAAEAERARIALRRQTAVVDMLDEMVNSVRPDQDGRDVTFYELLERQRGTLDTAFADDPQLRGALIEFFVNAYFALGVLDTAADLAESTLEAIYAQAEPDRIQSARVQRLLAKIRQYQFQVDDAQAAIDAAVRDLELAGDRADPSDVAATLHTRAIQLNSRARFEDSAQAFRELLAYAERELAADDPLLPTAMGELAELVSSLQQPEEAEQWARRGLELARRELGPRSAWAALSGMRLGNVLSRANELEEAESVLRETLELMTAIFGEPHPNTLQVECVLALNLSRQLKLEEGERVARHALEVVLREHEDDAIELEVNLRATLAGVLKNQGRKAEQIAELRTAVARMESVGQGSHPLTEQLRDWLARTENQ